jgi:hypothetical protein
MLLCDPWLLLPACSLPAPRRLPMSGSSTRGGHGSLPRPLSARLWLLLLLPLMALTMSWTW